MSGIYGIYRYDGGPVDPEWLERMKTAMAYYGPHGGGCKIEGQVGLGHLLLEVNPEDAFEKQPMRGERGLVVSTARLDNREALLEAFDVSSSEAAGISDGQLVSLAFDRWGDEVSKHLQGDWALAAWDARQRRLLLARDAFGNVTLYYYEGNGFFAFASSLKALLALPGVVKEPDRMRLAEVLVIWQHDGGLTAYKGFRRLLWAQAMAVTADGKTRIWQHWSPQGRAMLNYRRDEDYVEAFLEHYTHAVQICLRTQKPVAATLSAGRDSGSVVAMAAPLLAGQGRGLTAYTSVPCLPPDGAKQRHMGNEWELAHATAVMAGDNIQHVPIDATDYGVIQGIEHFQQLHDGPGHGSINFYWMQAVAEAASRNGAGVILTGQAGNITVSWTGNGSALLALLQGYPATALRLFLNMEPNPWLTIKRQILKPLLLPGLLAFRRRTTPPSRIWQEYSALNIHIASELDLDGRMRAAGHDPTFKISPLEDYRLRLFSPFFCIGTGLWSEIGARNSVAFLDPTSNQAMLEFLLQVPDDQFQRLKQSSWLFRRAFKGRLPDPVVNQERKGLQAADVGHRILRELPALRQCLDSLDALPEAREFLDMQRIRRCLEDLVVKVDPDTTQRAGTILLRGLGVGLFLRHLAESRN